MIRLHRGFVIEVFQSLQVAQYDSLVKLDMFLGDHHHSSDVGSRYKIHVIVQHRLLTSGNLCHNRVLSIFVKTSPETYKRNGKMYRANGPPLVSTKLSCLHRAKSLRGPANPARQFCFLRHPIPSKSTEKINHRVEPTLFLGHNPKILRLYPHCPSQAQAQPMLVLIALCQITSGRMSRCGDRRRKDILRGGRYRGSNTVSARRYYSICALLEDCRLKAKSRFLPRD